MYKEKIIDWFCYNEPTIKYLYNLVLARKIEDHFLFEDEYCEQFNILLKEEVYNYITKCLGCPLEEIYSVLDDEMFWKYMNRINYGT